MTKLLKGAPYAALLSGALLFGVTFTASGCVAPGQVSAHDLKPALDKVCDRHDNYVQADSATSALQKKVFLRSTKLLRQIVDEAVDREAEGK